MAKPIKLGEVWVDLELSRPGWSWLYGGLIYQPLVAHLRGYQEVRKKVRKWYGLWLYRKTETVREERDLAELGIHALGVPSNIVPGTAPADLGTRRSIRCSHLTFTVKQIGFPVPPWAGGGGWKGLGFRAFAFDGQRTVALSDHWGSSDFLPEDHL